MVKRFVLLFYGAGILLAACFPISHAAAENVLSAPEFTALSREADTLIIKGKAVAASSVELVNGADIIGKTQASAAGTFSITLSRSLKAGEHRFVLRLTDAQGRSVTSLQTLLMTIPENKDGDILALVEEPGKSSRLLAGSDKANMTKIVAQQDFAVDTVTYSAETLSVCGKSKPGTRVFIAKGGSSIGSERPQPDGRFCIVRRVAIEAGDHILQAGFFDDSGAAITTINLPFTVRGQQKVTRQVYRSGQAVDTVVVKRGETLSLIAKRVYGNGALADILFEANRDILQRPDSVRMGVELVVPRRSEKRQ